MLKRLLLTGVATVIFASSAYAYHCPLDMAKIDAVLPVKISKLSAARLAKVKTLRTRGEVEHKAGNHDASVKTLAQAMKILGIK